MRTGEVWLLRHAETAWSRERRHTGRSDIALTDAGRDEARALHGALAVRPFALVLCSPLARARETAELAGLGDRAQPRDDLLEWDYGEVEGVTTAQWRERVPGWDLWRDGAPGGETAGEVGARVDRVLAEALDVLAGGDVALVAHAHVLRVAGARWLGQPPAFGAHLVLDTARIARLGFERETQVLRAWNVAPA